jgi:hypothetical protein
MPNSFASRDMVVVFPLPAGPLRSSSLLRDLPLRTSVSHVRTSATFFLCTASSSSDMGPYFSVHGRRSAVDSREGGGAGGGGGVLREPLAVRRNFCLLFTAWSLSAVAPGLARLRTGRAVEGFAGRLSSELSKISSTCSCGVALFSGLGVGCSCCGRGALLKKEVMGLCIGLGFAGDLALAGDFWADGARVLGEAARRVWVRAGFASPRAPSLTLNSVPLLGRRAGGVCGSSASESEESTTGCLRTALGLAIPPRLA